MEFSISESEKKFLLSQARESILSHLQRRKPNFESMPSNGDSALSKPCGAFVSLHTKDTHSLRGCIGRMSSDLPLTETVRMMAIEAAFGDPRFPPLNIEELNNCNIEISALSPMSPCPDPMQVIVGVHGLLLRKGGRSGVLLPQVPAEQGWSLSEYLDYICRKAGLPQGAYKDTDAQLYTFTAQVFCEQ